MSSEYRPIRRIAMGGMAEVLLALQLGIEGFEKLVVVKRILPHLRQDKEFVQMFLEEARLAASLRHQNIVETLDIYRDEEHFFIALEYISGEDLRYIIARQKRRGERVPVPIACRIMADVAAGLDYAHNSKDIDGKPRGIVHRDVGPSNILVGYQGISKLVDFGVAKANSANIYTKPGVLKGKFGYMAPEHVQHKKLDSRADVFSLGVVLHELLTGQRLFKEPTLAAVIRSLMEKEPVAPSSVNPDVPPALDAIVAEALAKDRDQRTQSAARVREQLEELLAEIGTTSHQDVAEWMQSTFSERRQRRMTMEREVVIAGREAPQITEEVSTPLFDGMTGGSGPHSGSGSAGIAPQVTGPQIPGSGASNISGSINPYGTGSQVMIAPVQDKGKGGWLVALGAIGALLLVGAVAAGFILGRGPDEQPKTAAAGATNNAANVPDEPPPGPAVKPSATLIVHVHPKGAEVVIDGKRHVKGVGPTGTMVAIDADTKTKLKIQKQGFVAHEQFVTLAAETTEHIHVNLKEAGAKEPAVAAVEPAKPVVKVAAVAKKKKPRRVYRPRRGKKAPKQPEPEKTGDLVISFTPGNAVLTVDGSRKSGRSPITLEDLKPGSHTISLRAKGHRSVTHSVTIRAGQEHKISFQLQKDAPRMASLDLISAPSGATITVDGVAKGRAPLVGLKLSPGESHTVKAVLAGYKPWTSRITPSAGRNPPVIATLTPVAAPKPAAGSTEAAPARVAALRVPMSRKGDAATGAGLFRSKCGQCHGSSARTISPKRYTQQQWSRYFSTGRHVTRAPLAKKMSAGQLAHVKAYLMSRAADVDKATAAGVR